MGTSFNPYNSCMFEPRVSPEISKSDKHSDERLIHRERERERERKRKKKKKLLNKIKIKIKNKIKKSKYFNLPSIQYSNQNIACLNLVSGSTREGYISLR